MTVANRARPPAAGVYQQLRLTLRVVDGLPAGYVVGRVDPHVLAATPFAAGDVLVQVDGAILDKALLAELARSASGGNHRVLIERGGQEMEVILRAPLAR
jgi:hypothetical protein